MNNAARYVATPSSHRNSLRLTFNSIESLNGVKFKKLIANLCFMLCLSTTASALVFTPDEREWSTWPDYCRARYIASGAGIGSHFESRVSPVEVARQEATLGEEVWYWLHHYCAGLAYLSRASAEVDNDQKRFWLNEANVNIMGHYHRVKKSNPMFPEFIIGVATLHRQLGDSRAALSYLQESIDSHPEATSPYAFSAQILRQDHRLRDALDILKKGDEAANGQSAEIHYFIAHVYIDLKQMDMAVTHAKRAYELGYPLPGLAAKLNRLGYSVF